MISIGSFTDLGLNLILSYHNEDPATDPAEELRLHMQQDELLPHFSSFGLAIVTIEGNFRDSFQLFR